MRSPFDFHPSHNRAEKTTLYLWPPSAHPATPESGRWVLPVFSVLVAISILLSSCASTPEEAADEAAAVQEREITRLRGELSAAVERASQAEEAVKVLTDRNRNLARQNAELAADVQVLEERISEIAEEHDSLKQENQTLKRVVDDILLTQGILRSTPATPSRASGAGDSGPPTEVARTPPEAPEPILEQPPSPRPEPPSPQKPEPSDLSTPTTALLNPPRTTGEIEPGDAIPDTSAEEAGEHEAPGPAADGGRPAERAVTRGRPVTAESSAAGEADATPPQGDIPASPDAGRREASRVARESNLRVERDPQGATVRYFDSRLAYDSRTLCYLSVGMRSGGTPMLYLHLRVTAADGSVTPQAAVLETVGQRIRLDASNSRTIRSQYGDLRAAEVVARVSPSILASLRSLVRQGGAVTIQGLEESVGWELSPLERVAMTNMLYAYQDLGGVLP